MSCNEQVPFNAVERTDKIEFTCVFCGFTLDVQPIGEKKKFAEAEVRIHEEPPTPSVTPEIPEIVEIKTPLIEPEVQEPEKPPPSSGKLDPVEIWKIFSAPEQPEEKKKTEPPVTEKKPEIRTQEKMITTPVEPEVQETKETPIAAVELSAQDIEELELLKYETEEEEKFRLSVSEKKPEVQAREEAKPASVEPEVRQTEVAPIPEEKPSEQEIGEPEPVQQEPSEQELPETREPATDVSEGCALIADPSKDTREMIENIIREKNSSAHIMSFENGLELISAHSRLLSEKHPADIVILALKMPVMGGLTAVRAMRTVETRNNAEKVPVVLFFSEEDADEKLEDQINKLENLSYIIKSSNPDEFAKQIKSIISGLLEEHE